jgi:signal transduction histidine kinase
MNSTNEASIFVVADNGPGIPPNERDRIFAPYYQRSSSNLPSAISGVGLGLAIVRGIVQHHGGTIELDSDIGKGCRFTVTLPHSHTHGVKHEG